MADKTSTILIKAQVEGTQKGTADLNNLGAAADNSGRRFRNMGDHARDSARSFSDAAKGMGGFVGSYAGAAATFFAIQQGFSALANAAKFDQTIQGTKTLATAMGESGDKILSSIVQITRGQLSLKEAAESANLALSSGFSADKIAQLTAVATKASSALGRDLNDSFTRVVRGATKLEPELLDELGLFTRLEPAIEAYAVSTGKAVSMLTNFERRQAFMNAIIEEGERKFGLISSTTDNASVSLQKLIAQFTNLGYSVGGGLVAAFKPFADFLNDSLIARITVFLQLVKMAGSVGLSALTGFISSKIEDKKKEVVANSTARVEKELGGKDTAKKLAGDFSTASAVYLNNAKKSGVGSALEDQISSILLPLKIGRAHV